MRKVSLKMVRQLSHRAQVGAERAHEAKSKIFLNSCRYIECCHVLYSWLDFFIGESNAGTLN